MQNELGKERVKIDIETNFQEVFSEREVRMEKLSGWLKLGLVRELTPQIYSANMNEEPAAIIRRNWDNVIPKLYPGSLISHRTVLKGLPPEESHVYLTSAFTKNVELPGLTLHFKQGHPPLKDDPLYRENLYVSQLPRAYLENMQTHTGAEANRTVPIEEVDQRLDVTIQMHGEGELLKIRNKAEELAHKLGMTKEFEKLNVFFMQLIPNANSKVPKSLGNEKPIERKFRRRLKR